jgi:hypothetical protein
MTWINQRDGDKTKINMKHLDADHTDIGSTKSPLCVATKNK